MSAKTIINVYPRRRGFLHALMTQTAFWGFLVGAIGLSHSWFGGSWVIDLSAFCMAVIGLTSLAMRADGFQCDVSVRDLQEWARSGAPDDLGSWLRARS